MPALDTITLTVTAPGGAITPMVALAGDSLAVRNANGPLPAMLLQAITAVQGDGILQITHPSGHDQVRDLRYITSSTAPIPLMSGSIWEPLQAQENLSVALSGSGTAGDVEITALQVYYPDLPGVAAILRRPEEIWEQTELLVTVQQTITPTAAGTYSGAQALNATSDLLLANRYYAVLGATMNRKAGILTLKGTDLGNLRVSVPCINNRPDITADYFTALSLLHELPLVPVINSTNKAAIFTEVVQDENLTAVPYAWHLALLKPAWRPA